MRSLLPNRERLAHQNGTSLRHKKRLLPAVPAVLQFPAPRTRPPEADWEHSGKSRPISLACCRRLSAARVSYARASVYPVNVIGPKVNLTPRSISVAVDRRP